MVQGGCLMHASWRLEEAAPGRCVHALSNILPWCKPGAEPHFELMWTLAASMQSAHQVLVAGLAGTAPALEDV